MALYPPSRMFGDHPPNFSAQTKIKGVGLPFVTPVVLTGQEGMGAEVHE